MAPLTIKCMWQKRYNVTGDLKNVMAHCLFMVIIRLYN